VTVPGSPARITAFFSVSRESARVPGMPAEIRAFELRRRFFGRGKPF